MRLHDRIAARIRVEGPLRFDLFMEAALYDPEGGYYEREGRVGRGGDFVTGPSWHPAFGRTIARIARRLDLPDLVDVGAGEGELLAAADSALRAWGIREKFRLIGVERSETRRRIAAERCPGATWLSSLEEISSPVSGLIVAYELFDALPVRALLFDGEKLLERVVSLEPGGEGFAWSLAPCADAAELLERFRARGIRLLRNQQLEIRPGAAGLATALAARLSSGLLLVFDYGAPAKALHSAGRANGTLEAFVAHTVTRDVLSGPGGRDLTAWVDFTEIAEALAGAGLDVAGPVSQSRVLASAGIFKDLEIDAAAPLDAAREADRRAAAALVQPGGMGESIRVLLASRGTALGSTLASWPRHK